MSFFKILRYSAFIMLATSALSCSRQSSEWFVDSPSGNLRFTVILADSGRLFYTVTLNDSGKTYNVMEPSPLGIIREDESFDKDLVFEKADDIRNISEDFELPSGKRRTIDNQATELTLTFRNQSGTAMQVTARAYNDGVAFRYAFPDPGKSTILTREITGFDLAGSGTAWMQPYDKVTQYTPAYETYYQNAIPTGTPSPSVEGWAFPALFRTTEAWVLLTEAAVDTTCYAAHLQQQAEGGEYSIRQPEEEEAEGIMPGKASLVFPWTGPWRVIIIGTHLSAIVESNMVVKLNPPATLTDVSWVKPGRASWSWWSEPASPKNYTALKKFVDLAAEMGWEYSLVDANWDLMKGGSAEQLIQYANSKNVGILLWYNSGGPHNVVTERPRDIMSDPVRRKEEFRRISALGVKGVKVDFFQSDKQEMIKLYFDILKDAAESRIMVVFHGCTLPRGWNRTWPNLVSMEAVRGAENYGYDSLYPERAVWHNTILPFTRNVVGSMDYTPVTFTNQKYPHLTTNGYEMALSVIFESGILHFADRVEFFRTLPDPVKDFFRNVPAAWDETLLLDGEPGKFCIMARRNGDTWYIGGINGTGMQKSWELDLSRLGNHGTSAEIITDGADETQFVSEARSIEPEDKLIVKILPNGGFVAVLKK